MCGKQFRSTRVVFNGPQDEELEVSPCCLDTDYDQEPESLKEQLRHTIIEPFNNQKDERN